MRIAAWTLNVQDRGSPDTGSFTQFTINATAVPFEFEPTGGVVLLVCFFQ